MFNSSYCRTICRLCNQKNIEIILPLTPTPVADAYVPEKNIDKPQKIYPLNVGLCRTCGFVQLLEVVHPNILYGNYLYETTTSPGLAKHYEMYADSVLRRSSLPLGSFVVEIGSNDGTLLKCFKHKGMKVLGVDPAENVAQKSGVETIIGYYNTTIAKKIKKNFGPADVVIANNVIANIDNLTEVFQGIRELLAPRGLFFFETGYFLSMMNNMVFDNVYHEHLSYFSVKPLISFLHQLGMSLIDVEIVPTKGGSLRGIIQLTDGPHAISKSVLDLIHLEENHGLYQSTTYKDYRRKLNKTKKNLTHLLKKLKSQNKTIVGYGASPSVTTVLYHFDISTFLNFIVDDNPKKQNLFSPGHHIPILPSEEIYKQKPDYILILPWRFSDSIIQKHKAYQERGGHFITYLPEIRLI